MGLFLDIVIIVLVTVMIGYSVVLNIKLKTFRNTQNEMSALITQLNNIILQAQANIETLKKTAEKEEGRLKDLILKSRMLADELAIINESGSNLADRIERGLVSKPAEEKENFDTDDTENEEDNELLESLKNIR
ncbi:MAG: DUF6468 domain-containing protein [Emcibacter sp.]|nr:DUF6468 domain-containing protein [Emcibacter sp.]